MDTYQSGVETIRVDQHEVQTATPKPALILLHGSGGAVAYWTARFGPSLAQLGISLYSPHYFDKTGTVRASAETILDGRHVPQWLTAIEDAVTYVGGRPGVDPAHIALLGISLGGYLAVATGAGSSRVRAIIELSGGVPPGFEDRITSSMPPVLIVHGTEDSVVPVSEAHKLASLLAKHSVSHQLELLAGETHWFSQGTQPRLLLACATFLSQHLAPARS